MARGHSRSRLIFLHGGGLHAHTFDVVGNLLRDQAAASPSTSAGTAKASGSPGRYGSDETADDLTAVVAHLGLKRVVVVGHSMGGIGAIAWAARRPPELAGLVIVDVGPELSNPATASINDFITSQPSFADLEEVEAVGTSPPRQHGGQSALARRRTARLQVRRLAVPPRRHPTARRRRDARVGPPDRLPHHDSARVSAARCSPMTAPAEFAGLIAGATGSRVEDAGHTIQSSNPRGLASAVADFLDRTGALTMAITLCVPPRAGELCAPIRFLLRRDSTVIELTSRHRDHRGRLGCRSSGRWPSSSRSPTPRRRGRWTSGSTSLGAGTTETGPAARSTTSRPR